MICIGDGGFTHWRCIRCNEINDLYNDFCIRLVKAQNKQR